MAGRDQRVLYLATDGFGGHGGIALHCRHSLKALAADPAVASVVAIARVPPVYREDIPRGIRYLDQSPSSAARYLNAILRHGLLTRRWHVVVCGHIHLLPLAAAIALLHRARLRLVIFGFEAWTCPRNHSAVLYHWAMKRVRTVVSISRVTRDRFLQWSGVDGSRVAVVPNGLEPGIYAPGPRPTALQTRYGIKDEPVIMTVGRLSAAENAKGFEQIIRLMPSLLRAQPDLKYIIVGDGDDRQRLTDLATSLGVADQVVFTGQIPDDEKADHFRLASAYIMPSRLEGFGYVFLEAMASGLPVVGSTLDASNEPLMDGELGKLVDPDDPNELQSAIHWALDQPQAVPAALSRFSLDRFFQGTCNALLHRQ